MPGFDTLLFNTLDDVAYIRLNRPNVLNAYNMQMRDDFHWCCRRCRTPLTSAPY